jgi:predicted AAA+ superfamily ATPase
MINRHLSTALMASLGDSPAVFVQGARQTGKSTLVRALDRLGHDARYLTLDDAAVRGAANADPQAFINAIDTPVIIDEVQRVPGLALAIKKAVDQDRSPGRFLLTGSANALALPKLSESLAGRMELHTLWPFSQGELSGQRGDFIDAVFKPTYKPVMEKPVAWPDLVGRMLRGGYPEAVERQRADRRDAWFGSYITAILQRDVRDLANIEGLTEMPRLLRLLASRVGSLINFADLSRSLSMPQSTLKRYMSLLAATFLVQEVPAWSVNIGKRLIKSPKLFLNDTGLIAHLLGLDADRFERDPLLVGHLFENFVVMELLKQIGWSNCRPALMHFRTTAGQEVDIILEDRAGNIVGIEVKAAETITGSDFKGLKTLAEAAGDRFTRGLVLYRGDQTVAFDRQLLALNVMAAL